MTSPGLIVPHEHLRWQVPLFAAPQKLAFINTKQPVAKLYFNQARPSDFLTAQSNA